LNQKQLCLCRTQYLFGKTKTFCLINLDSYLRLIDSLIFGDVHDLIGNGDRNTNYHWFGVRK